MERNPFVRHISNQDVLRFKTRAEKFFQVYKDQKDVWGQFARWYAQMVEHSIDGTYFLNCFQEVSDKLSKVHF